MSFGLSVWCGYELVIVGFPRADGTVFHYGRGTVVLVLAYVSVVFLG